MWCGGARETYLATHKGVTVTKRNSLSNLPAFLDLNRLLDILTIFSWYQQWFVVLKPEQWSKDVMAK